LLRVFEMGNRCAATVIQIRGFSGK